MELPAQIAAEAALADDMQKKLAGEKSEPAPEQQVQQDTQQEQAEPVQVAETQPATPEAEDKFRDRYYSLKGKYDGEVPALSRAKKDLEAQLQAMREENKKLRMEAAEYRRKGNGLTQKDEEVLGADIVDAIRRGSSEAVGQIASDLEILKTENENLKAHNASVVEEAKHAALQEWKERALDKELPDWRALNKDPDFLSWLERPIPGTNIPKQIALSKADAECDIPFIVKVFKQFKDERAGVRSPALSRQVQPKESRVSGTSTVAQQPKWTQAKVSEFYERARRGQYTPEQFAQLEKELNDVLQKNNGQLPPY